MVNIKSELNRLWTDSASLTMTGILMLAALGAFVVGLVLDPRTITGVPAWLKPAKFAISTAIFSLTIAWLFRYITVWRPFLRAVGRTLSAVLIIEVAIIALQAARGTTSHFNMATSFDTAMFRIMGTAIAFLWIASVAVLAALLRQRFENPAWGWWLRLGMLVTVLGSAAGGLMLRMTPEQIDSMRSGRPVRVVGGHTVGAPDSEPGLPVTGWSAQHGDLRIAHFFGLHGVQILPFLGWLAMRRYRVQVQTRLAFAAATSYAGFTGILAWQALRGQSIIAPDVATLAALAFWLAGTLAAGYLVRGEFIAQQAAASVKG
jgi:hypothetical protein